MLKKKGRRALLYFWRGGLVQRQPDLVPNGLVAVQRVLQPNDRRALQVSALISTSTRSSGVRSMRKGAALLRCGVKGSDSLGDRFGGL
jgi:hypothetical protein